MERISIFGNRGPLRRVYSSGDFELIVGHTHEERFSENGYQQEKGGEFDGRKI